MSVGESLQKGTGAARAGRRAEARSAFRAVLRRDPFNETALLWLAYLDEDPRASLAYIARALEGHRQSPRARAALRWARQRVTALSSRAAAPRRSPSPPPKSPPRRRGVRRGVVWMAALGATLLLTVLAVWALGLSAWASPPAVAAPVLVFPTPSPSATAVPSPTPTTTP
ncbi:MAG TPA: hypothetical protein EYP77_10575, partial [Anaerolineae bacterium]|nr:hypothetical protein [Anaerolineae bacterium]